ncbi:arylphorin subunit alpha-like [Aricia agestis]|uniref:arylphorin subunit alpha-like n=1 Tax=Aricia agestis TaxID=91739 RepID=UPI001C20A981|nr:arylphorin subunit alpha-like [Aricia agestis]
MFYPCLTPPVVVGRVHIQKLLLPLFEDVCEESSEPIVMRLSEEFQLNPKDGSFIDPTVIDNFISHRSTKGLLPKGEIFSEYNDDHMNELKIITQVLINAENFDTFYKAACWARQNVNCGIFIDAIYLAILRRRDTERVLLPAVYEVLPNYFVRKDFLIKASTLVSGGDTSLVDARIDGNSYIIDVNYTENYFDNSIEQMTYFNEDVDLNSYYFFNKLKMLKWFKEDLADVNSRRGQYIYQTMKQLDARYNLERYSIGLPEVDTLDWDTNDECIYDPMLIFSNGNDFSKRPSPVSQNGDTILILKNIEHSVTSTINQMRAAGSEKTELFNYLIDVLVTSENSFENIAMKMYSNINLQTGTTSVLGHYITTIRDPIYWRLNKKILKIIDNNLKVLPPYETNELYFPGVEVTNIDIKKPSTSCDNFEFDVTDALRNKEIETNFQIKFNQQRLSSKPLTIKISISSLVMEKALIKIYIGPKFLPGQFPERKNWFMQVDSFETNLKVGTNTITRSSNEMNNISDGFISLEKIRKYIQDAEFGIDALPLRTVESQTGFPSRLLLPRGSSAPFQLFVFVAPFVKAVAGGTRNYMQSNYDAILSPGYPMDLNIDIQNLFNLPNALVKDIIITHKSAVTPHSTDVNGNNDWQKDYTEYRNGPTSLASTYAKSTLSSKNFDYKSKSEKYGKKDIDTKPRPINNDIENTYNINTNIKDKNTDNAISNNSPKVIDPIENDNRLTESNDVKTEDQDINKEHNNILNEQLSNGSVIKKLFESNAENKKNTDEIGTKTAKTDYERIVTIDKNINNDYSKNTQNDQVVGRSDNVVIKHIESKDGKYVTNNDGIDTPIAKNEYDRVVTIDKNINNDYTKDIQDSQVIGQSDNVVIKHIESKDGKNIDFSDGVDTPGKNTHEKVVTIDKNINNDYTKDIKDGPIIGRSDNVVVKHIDSKGGKSNTIRNKFEPGNSSEEVIDKDVKTDSVMAKGLQHPPRTSFYDYVT